MSMVASGTFDHVVEGAWLRVERSIRTEGNETIVIANLSSLAQEPIAARVVDEFPESWHVRTVGLHPEYEPDSFEADESHVVFEHVLEPRTSITVVYGIRVIAEGTVEPLGEPAIELERLLSRDDEAGDLRDGQDATDPHAAEREARGQEFIWSEVEPGTDGRDDGHTTLEPEAGVIADATDGSEFHEDLRRLFESADAEKSVNVPDGDSRSIATGDGGTTVEQLSAHPRIGPRTAQVLQAAGYRSVADLRASEERELASIEGIGRVLAADIIDYLDADDGMQRPDPELDHASTDTVGTMDDEVSDGTDEGPAAGLGEPASSPGPEPAAEVDPETLAEADNLLVLAEHDQTEACCVDLFEHQGDQKKDLLLVSFVESADERLEVLSQLPPAERDVKLICMGEPKGTEATDRAEGAVPREEVTVTAISDSTDLFRLGVHLSRALEEAEGQPTLCLHSLTALVGLMDLQRVFRFLHVLSGRIKSVDGQAHFHLDPDAVDERASSTLRPLFDLVVRFEDGRYTLE